MKIAITSFALRHWQPDASGTRIEGLSSDELVTLCQSALDRGADLVAGYAPFCKHLFLENPTPTLCGFAPITDENHHLLRSGYVARRDGELAVLERWFEGLPATRAGYFDVILYSHAQLEKEAAAFPDDGEVPDCDWGIVSIIATLAAEEPPMPPITQIRNALGASEGGSGVAIDKQAYEHAVEFWNNHASVR